MKKLILISIVLAALALVAAAVTLAPVGRVVGGGL